MYLVCDDSTLLEPGSPIRKSPGQRLLATSPKLIADCYVLHRQNVSRHPPYALELSTTKTHNCFRRLFCLLTLFAIVFITFAKL